jgi:hypothetical protein
MAFLSGYVAVDVRVNGWAFLDFTPHYFVSIGQKTFHMSQCSISYIFKKFREEFARTFVRKWMPRPSYRYLVQNKTFLVVYWCSFNVRPYMHTKSLPAVHQSIWLWSCVKNCPALGKFFGRPRPCIFAVYYAVNLLKWLTFRKLLDLWLFIVNNRS